MTDARKELEITLGRVMKSIADAGAKKHKANKAREDGASNIFEVASAHRTAEKTAHEHLDKAIAAYATASAAGVITLEVSDEST